MINRVASATNEKASIKSLAELAEFYYLHRAEAKGDSVLQKQIFNAELSNDKNLVLEALFSGAIENVSKWSSTETFDRALKFVDKGVMYARSMGRADYEVIGSIRKAGLYRKRGDNDKALEQMLMAVSSLSNTTSDSLKSVVYLETGRIFLAKKDAISAYKNYNSAFDLAYKNNNVPLQSECYHHFAELYQSLSDVASAKKNLLRSFEINSKAGYEFGMLHDYKDLARLTDEQEYIDKLLKLAGKLKSDKYLLSGKILMYAIWIVVKQDSKAALDYLHANEDLNQYYLNTGMPSYYWNIGNVYFYSNRPDSAIRYYTLAEPGLNTTFESSVRQALFHDMGESYLQLNQFSRATVYFEKALLISEQQNDFSLASAISSKLSALYANGGDYKKAFDYTQKNIFYKDTLEQLNEQKEVVLLEVDRESKKHEKDLADAEANARRTRNLQYTGIAIAIASVFAFMILMGMFPVSRVTIKMLSFFAFICLFEFIVLLVDSYLHKVTHGEPLKIWSAKIILIAILVPIQHYLEHGVVHFLASQRLLRMRQHLSIRKMWRNTIAKIKKPPAPEDVGIEEDTAVL